MLDGEFQTMRAFIRKLLKKKHRAHSHLTLFPDALNETNPGMHITEDAILQIELGFRKMRELFQCKKRT